MTRNNGQDTITDFVAGTDKLAIVGVTKDGLSAWITSSGANWDDVNKVFSFNVQGSGSNSIKLEGYNGASYTGAGKELAFLEAHALLNPPLI